MFTSRFVCVIAAAISLLVLGAANAQPQCTQDWIGGEPFPGVNGTVGASLVWDADGAGPGAPVLVVAGEFAIAGPVPAARIATWDGTQWASPFGAGLNGPVRALTIFNGNLIAAGEFSQAGATPASMIAQWDGTNWQPLGLGTDGAVYALAVYNGRLYAGGTFANAGGTAASAIASWDGTAWSSVGSSGADGPVYSLCVLNSALYAGGDFLHVDNVAASGIASWNGSSWSPLGTGVGPADVRALVVNGGWLYVGGGITTAGGLTAYGVARWNGTAWAAAGQGLFHRTCVNYHCVNHPYSVAALGTLGNLVYAATNVAAGGTPLIFKFDGTSWTTGGTFSSPATGSWPATSLTAFDGVLYLGGGFGNLNTPNNIAKLSGTNWTMLHGMDGQVTGLTLYNNQLVAAGNFTQIDGTAVSRVASWDGTNWYPLGAGLSAPAYDVAAAGPSLYASVWPGGVVQFDGTAWTTLYGAGSSGAPPAIGSWNGQILAGLWGGAFGATGEETDPSCVGMWNGSGWVPMGTASSMTQGPNRFATLGGTLYAAFYSLNSSVSRWTGSEWREVGTNTLGYATSVAANNNTLYAAMSSTSGTGGLVAKLVGSDWQQLGASFDDAAPDSVASANGVLYAIGPFTSVGGMPINGIAQWDGAAWQPLGLGVSGAVLTLAGYQNQLAAGGSFGAAGGRGFARFARYGCAPTPLRGDANCDGVVNTGDVAAFVVALLDATAYSQQYPTCSINHSDTNSDGFVDAEDIASFIAAIVGP